MNKTGLAWAKEYGVLILDPDGFGERTKGVPLTTDLMTELEFKKGVGRSTCKFLDMDLFRSKYEANDRESQS
ncbi:hypothetical protein CMI37_06925 [Candidatus Pacearchaeota archaeon]|nr:hypothetical protein [Candidatus Pacearchaeota archaeon]|tara:strand:- start:7805 stop:8020 length:216 start_codon:yes stop_codon:yes gene_type:complete